MCALSNSHKLQKLLKFKLGILLNTYEQNQYNNPRKCICPTHDLMTQNHVLACQTVHNVLQSQNKNLITQRELQVLLNTHIDQLLIDEENGSTKIDRLLIFKNCLSNNLIKYGPQN